MMINKLILFYIFFNLTCLKIFLSVLSKLLKMKAILQFLYIYILVWLINSNPYYILFYLCHIFFFVLFLVAYIASTYVDNWQIPFTTYHLLQYLGMALSFSVSNYLGSQIKVCILAASLMMSIVPYTILEFRIHHRNVVHDRTAVLWIYHTPWPNIYCVYSFISVM